MNRAGYATWRDYLALPVFFVGAVFDILHLLAFRAAKWIAGDFPLEQEGGSR